MSLTALYQRYMFGLGDAQENADYDGNGNEIYHGWGLNTILTSQPFWTIAKAVYTPATINGSNVYLLTHSSFLRNQIWDNRTSIVFP
jgi:hypothetical protein